MQSPEALPDVWEQEWTGWTWFVTQKLSEYGQDRHDLRLQNILELFELSVQRVAPQLISQIADFVMLI